MPASVSTISPTAGRPRLPAPDFRLLNQMRFEHFTHDFCNAGRRQLRKTGEVDARHRAKLINQAIYCSCIGLLYLIDMAADCPLPPLTPFIFALRNKLLAMVKHLGSTRQIFT